ncbi:Irc19p Ecym_6219 [Eremothecium cymbalariae DBVPG|uniref:Increased recombination centers protein 19 n=1 Tax=Eremothecium cymbalariae (strain CBS 270.75 / DBVPG 7215 / KCTC 17166 / NRRL Y-17582) TaxID=931890 RepID=G8JVC2_ERECY|nr:hypothetical protein Ecym_6219 [Eremothecium cymbalariae DBVPG\
MIKVGPLITTPKAIMTKDFTLIINKSPYTLPTDFQKYSRSGKLRVLYRRFIRLRPFISRRAMIRGSYTNYIRHKFHENYELKRDIVLKSSGGKRMHDLSDIEMGCRTLTFVQKAVSHVDGEGEDGIHGALAHDNLICKRILKNLLTIEFHRERLEFRNAVAYRYLRLTFEYLDPTYRNLKYASLRHADTSIIHLNELLGTRL